MIEISCNSRGVGLDDALRRITEDLAAFRGDALVKDDQTMIAVELVP